MNSWQFSNNTTRSYVWWPGVDKNIENEVRCGKQCQSVKQAQLTVYSNRLSQTMDLSLP